MLSYCLQFWSMYLQVHYASLNFDPTTTGFSVWYFVFCMFSSLFLYFFAVAVVLLHVFPSFVIIFTIPNQEPVLSLWFHHQFFSFL